MFYRPKLHKKPSHIDYRKLRRRGIKLPRKSYLMVIRLNCADELSDSKCCSLCTAMMKAVNISAVYYTNKNGKIERHKIRDMELDFISSGLRIAIKNGLVKRDSPVYIIAELSDKNNKQLDHKPHPP